MVAAVRTPERNLSVVRSEKPTLSLADRLFKSLQKAREEDLKLFMEGESEKWFATSATIEGVIYAVSDHGCSCRGFSAYRCCKHWALYLEQQGKRPGTAAEFAAAYAERDRLTTLRSENKLKSTADWRNFHNAIMRVERLEANQIVCADLAPAV